MTYILKANRHYDGYDMQEEIQRFATREAADAAAAVLMGSTYISGEGELGRPSYVVVEDKTGEKHHDTGRTNAAADGDGTKTIKARAKHGKDSGSK